MEKLYNVVVNKGEDLDKLDKELAAPSGRNGIPNRPVKIGNPLVGNTRTTQWLLTEEEAEELKKDKRVLDVSVVDRTFFRKFGSGSIQGKMYRADGSKIYDKARDDYDNDTNAVPLINWGLGRHKEFTDPTTTVVDGATFDDYIPNDNTNSFNFQVDNQLAGLDQLASYGETYSYDYDGEGVDIVIMDTGIDGDHPEWEGADGNSRLQKIDWIVETGLQLVNDDGSAVTQTLDYYTDPDGHGTSCASLAAGYLNGFAKGAHIYALKLKELDKHGTGYSYLQACSLLKAWHNQKTTGRPTIVNMSFGSSAPVFTPHAIRHRGEILERFHDGTIFSHQPVDLALTNAEIAHKTGLKGVAGGYGDTVLDPTYLPQMFYIPFQSAADDAAVEDLTDAGIHVTIAAGNHGLKIDVDRNHPAYKQRSRYFGKDNVGDDWDNMCHAQYLYNFYQTLTSYYNRPSSPSHPTAFSVGALASTKVPNVDDFGKFEDDINLPYEVTGQVFAPNLPSNVPFTVYEELNVFNANEVKPEFSAHGNGVDIYAAGEDVLSAASMEAMWNDRADEIGLHLENYWDTYVHAYNTDLSRSHGLSIECDKSSINDKVRIYVKTTQELLDAVKDRGSTTLESLRLTLHYDKTDTDLIDMVETCASDVFESNATSALAYRSTLISHDYRSGAYGGDYSQRDLIDEDGVYAVVPKIASSFYKYHEEGALYLDTTYTPFSADLDNGFQGDPWDLDDSDNDGRVVFELCFWKSDFPAYDDATETFNGVPISELFTVGSVVVNKETQRDVDDYTVNALHGQPPYIAGHAYKTYTGTSMAAPSVAGMVAVNIEKEGNKTPVEMIDFMSTPYSGYGQKKESSNIAAKDGFDENKRVHRVSPPESANIGFDKDTLERVLYQGDNENPETWSIPWNSVYMTSDVVDMPNSYPVIGDQPHNLMVVGSKCLSTIEGQRRDYTATISGNLKFYSGAYEVNSTIELSPSEGLIPLNGSAIAAGETWDVLLTINGDTYGGEKPLRQDGEWIPKSLSSSLGGTISDIVSIGNGQFKASLTHDLNLTGSGLVNTVVSGTLLRPIVDTETIGMYPERPSLNNAVDTVDFTENRPDTATNLTVYTPTVTANGTHSIVIKPELDYNYFTAHLGSIKNALPLDFENADMPNPLQIKYYAQDTLGQKSDDGLLTINVIDVSDNPPVINGFPTTGSKIVWEHDAENAVIFENVSVTDIDHSSADITVKLEVPFADHTEINSIDHPSQVEALGLVFDASDLSNISLELTPLDYENPPTGWDTQWYSYRELLIKLIASDPDGNSSHKYFRIRLKNRTEKPVNLVGGNSPISLTLPEDTPIGTVVATIEIEDDSDNSPPHVFINVTDHNATWHTKDTEYLDVNNNGEVYVAKELDYETNTEGRLEVLVRNRFLEEASKTVKLTLTDVFDDPPNFVDQSGNVITTDTVTIQEHQDEGVQVYAFETDVASTFTLGIDKQSGSSSSVLPHRDGEQADYFRVEDGSGNSLSGAATSGVIVVDTKWFPDFEKNWVFTIQVNATNEYGTTTLEITPTITDVPFDANFDLDNFGNNGNPYIFEIDHGTPAGVIKTLSFTETPYAAPDTGIIASIFSTSIGGGNDSYGNNYGDTTNTVTGVQGLSFDRVTGEISLTADADHSVRSEFEFSVLAYSDVTGHFINRTVTIKVNPAFTGHNLLNSFHFIDAQAATSQYSAFNCVDIPFDIVSASNRRLYIGHNITTTTKWQNDVCIGGIQILDQNGTVLHNLYTQSSYFASTWSGANVTNTSAPAPSVVATNSFAGLGTTAVNNKWCLRSGTGSSGTGAYAGVAYSHHQSVFPVGVEVVPQTTGNYFLFREASGTATSGLNYARTSGTYAFPAQGSIRVLYHAKCGAGYDPLNTLCFGLA